ncbi:MAG TPA: 4-(cytidine 5'-diphospho)-2-C-methyl-D-erythritol kinase [Pyrinomonadaceae bacterium]|nr:4-(cytidine 5'-diphospho)-2-C-methyl-D-erythritol kinase [Pyrinomonadaceae bacterium]
MSQRTISIPAFAKINWSLHVLGKREDGYHEVETVLQTIGLYDTITMATTDDGSIHLWCDDPVIPADETNLVWRAAASLRERYAITKGVKIRLVKRIPSEAGLGGGSSDAAATLIGLANLWEPETSTDELAGIAQTLGSDVPFFFHGGTARATGRGDALQPLADTPEQHVLIIKPNANVSTTGAYAALNAAALTSSDSKPILFRSQPSEFSDSFDLNALDNDFEAVIFRLEPEIGRAKNALLKAGAIAARLSGSGSAVFGIFENQDAQERAIQAIELETGWRAFPCKTVGRSHYEAALGPAGGLLARLFGENAGA